MKTKYRGGINAPINKLSTQNKALQIKTARGYSWVCRLLTPLLASSLPSVSIIPFDWWWPPERDEPTRDEGEGNSIMRQMWAEIYDILRKLIPLRLSTTFWHILGVLGINWGKKIYEAHRSASSYVEGWTHGQKTAVTTGIGWKWTRHLLSKLAGTIFLFWRIMKRA